MSARRQVFEYPGFHEAECTCEEHGCENALQGYFHQHGGCYSPSCECPAGPRREYPARPGPPYRWPESIAPRARGDQLGLI